MTVKELFDKVYSVYHIDDSLEINLTNTHGQARGVA